ncbi:MAG: hypothetical protein V3W20_01400 [Candidatus Neomarinimicrobiota bacterium]
MIEPEHFGSANSMCYIGCSKLWQFGRVDQVPVRLARPAKSFGRLFPARRNLTGRQAGSGYIKNAVAFKGMGFEYNICLKQKTFTATLFIIPL